MRAITSSLVDLLIAELLADGDGALLDVRAQLRAQVMVTTGADGVPRLVLS